MDDPDKKFDDDIAFNSKSVLNNDDDTEDELPTFQDIIKNSDKEVITSSSSTTDYVEREKRSKKMKIVLLCLLGFAVVVVLGYGVYLLMQEDHSDPSSGTNPAVTTTAQPSTAATGTQQNTKKGLPLLSIVPNPVSVSDGPASLTASGSAFTTSSGISVNFTNGKVTPPTTACSITDTTDFCFGGTVTLANRKSNVYFFKDIVHSRFFENAESFKKVGVDGSTAAATMRIATTSSNPQPVLVVVLKDGSGVMIVSPAGSDSVVDSIYVK